ncbi:MAG: hypothetical protein A3I14_18645 [Candidatus Rokubacteria bacterium RIFCSPLOWO2_02_FULL_73_56]|nr:MAG: hypothetical protein A3D33_17200 [Candidatus Rokubacteria bacterium RIFCSPHIGHO2_02_FULL_73_26]OGL11944.1 MAG: hypothetical protein A3I14_18645 [Candidatus Rokubacteria bacterium RIFCSPLOWO2_02_FULL_73_56]OGL22779.1 MAG: hypothetical protein A3G44_16005 [Candidatus Rokubacteria bacterium RIFCSPLOWO2_12_FULL_73_47]
MRATRAPRAEGALLAVRVQPRAARAEVTGWQAGVLRLRVTAPPVEGEANRAVEALLARALGVAPSSVRVVRGARGRDKLVRIAGLGDADVRSRLG